MQPKMSTLLKSLLGVCLILSAGTAIPSAAQIRSEQPLTIPRLTGPITLDGFSDEPAWEAVEPIQLTVYQPVYLAEPSQRTEIRVAYDDDYLYASGRLYDTEPSGIRGNSLYRDEYSGDDVFSIILDTFNDNENALWFSTTPTSVRFDWAVANDAQTSTDFQGAINRSWNTFWDAASQTTDEGWFAEIRIPFSSLRFQDADGRVVMGLATYRYIARLNERHLYPDTPPNWSMGWAKASMAQDIVLEGVYSKKPLYITPYTLGGSTYRNTLNDDETAFGKENSLTGEAGIDLKYNLTSNLTMDLTVNTDFAQVEADDQQVNLTRLSLFFPEKRQFFQERAGIFEFSTGRVDRLFYSRRIGLDDDGNPVRILGGARVVGRIGSWDVGLINMQTGNSDMLPSENFGVLRLRRQVLNPYSYAGGMFTSRIGSKGAYNLAFGLDAILRPMGNEYLTLRLAGTADQEIIDARGFDVFESSLFRAQWERRTEQGLSYRVTTKRYGAEFMPDLGFITRENILATSGQIAYGWFGDQDDWYRRISPALSAVSIFRNADGSLETLNMSLPVSVETQAGTRMTFEPNFFHEDLLEPIEFPENTEVPVGSYRFYGFEAMRRGSSGRLLRSESKFLVATFYDGWRLDIGFGPSWTASKHLLLESEYEVNFVRFPDRDQSFEAHILRLKAQLALNTKASLNAFVQYSSVSDVITTNVRLRYNFREGNDLWLVYNEGTNMDRFRDFDLDRNRPIYPRRGIRLLLLKYTYTFRA